MNNSQIADCFSLLAKLMEIHGENSFKAKSYAAAAFNIEKLPMQLSEMDKAELFLLKGIGESSAKKIIELLETGELSSLKDIILKTPNGVVEMLNIKGIGPKKISVIWKEMGIETIGELLYACKENRLKLYKGFGEKTQKSVEENIEFYFQNQGIFLFAQTETVFSQIKGYLEKIFFPQVINETGAYRRHQLTIDEIEFVVNVSNDVVKQKMQSANPPALLDESETSIAYKLMNGLKIRFYTGTQSFTKRLFTTTGSAIFNETFNNNYSDTVYTDDNITDDSIIFKNAGIQYIEPYLRETADIIDKAKAFAIPDVIQPTDIKGIIHSHSTWSDGSNTVEEMAKAAIEKGFEYLVLSDHSKSAFYANGLDEERIKQQHRQIDEFNARLAPFKIFKSIESDILYDGNLDYSNSILSTFDLVIASVHSILKMTEEKAMQRLITAIENPYTTILGHPTGRLLLSRKGYPINHTKIIDACAANNVVIELNANPNRLDIDWQFIEYALKKNVLISINPDAHTIEGYDDIRYGVLAAQKGMLTVKDNLSSFGLKEFEAFLRNKKTDLMI
ncbi:PHP domain-containing protein [Ferruginibacter lapsinanis]|uniref:DNA polymerase/3'-5' exonuclease PolX n=1 Tax=Ferruginibacter lapsinanis TaxID=563172 RepID=UPI001E302D95|nr:DNA polymerase/3'-5' exonuclease PolX [Ferruginibacter lapsinanis]UEG49882.1 PHP domain-containing protein [Ferruginibacter lapsinanis]